MLKKKRILIIEETVSLSLTLQDMSLETFGKKGQADAAAQIERMILCTAKLSKRLTQSQWVKRIRLYASLDEEDTLVVFLLLLPLC